MSTVRINPHLSHVSYGQRWRQWQRIRDFREGSDQVKLQGNLYLPVPSGMDTKTMEGKDEYHNYKERASFYPVVDRTIEGITGVAFIQNPDYKVTKKMEDDKVVEALTIDGESANILAHVMVDEVISVGRFGVLVDLPAEEAPDNRAYASKYFAEHIFDWRREMAHGKRVLTMVLIQDGKERVNDKDAVRFLRLLLKNPQSDRPVYVIEEWVFFKDDVEKTAGSTGGGDFSNQMFVAERAARPPVARVPMVRGEPLSFIPFVFVNPKTLQPEIERPPMLDLVDVNRGHYINSADYEHTLYAGAHDTFYIIGRLSDQEKPREIGGGIIWTLPEDVKEVGTLSASGVSMDALLEALVQKEERMAALGARLIHQQKSGEAETAEAIRMKTRENASVLMKVIENSEKAMNLIMKFVAILMDQDPEKVSVTFNRDFIEARLSWDDAVKLVQVWQTGGMSEETYFDRAKRGGMFPADMTFEEYLEKQAEDEERKKEKAEQDGEENGEGEGNEEGDGEGQSEGSRVLAQGDTDHMHSVTLDADGNGTSSTDASEAAGSHSHAVENGVVQPAGTNNHTHPLE